MRRARVGMRVRSHFRAPWYGTIVGWAADPRIAHCVVVRITHDRNGKPIAKPNSARNLRTLDPAWLKEVPS